MSEHEACTDRREMIAAMVMGELQGPALDQARQHLAVCDGCRALHGAMAAEEQELRSAFDALEPDLDILPSEIVTKETHMPTKTGRWYHLIGAGAAAVACIALFVLLAGIWSAAPGSRVQAAEILARAASAASGLRSIHLKCRMRTLPADNFAFVAPGREFVPIELWKEFGERKRWRIEKPGRVAVMDGESTIMVIRGGRGIKVGPSQGAFDTDWLHNLAAVDKTIADELLSALAKGRDLKLTHEAGPDGSRKHVVSVEVKSGLEDSDYLKNKFFMSADTQRVYRFDAATGRLEALKVFCHTAKGDVLILEAAQIDYDQQIDPSVFALKVPEGVVWYEEPKPLPDNEKYERMKPQEAARAFFQACSREDWQEAKKFWISSIDDRFKKGLGGLEIIKIGEPFQSKAYAGWFVPYEIKLNSGETRKHNLALRKHPKAKRFLVDGGL